VEALVVDGVLGRAGANAEQLVAAAGALGQSLRPEGQPTVEGPVAAPEAVLEDAALLL
jgi:hypothetical protein